MRKRRLLSSQIARDRRMSDGVTIASGYARRLVEQEARRSGSPLHEAIAAVARRVRSPRGSIWGLLYRLPKQVHGDLALALETAVRRDIELEIGVLNVELVAIRGGVRRLDPCAIAEVETELARLRAILREGAR